MTLQATSIRIRGVVVSAFLAIYAAPSLAENPEQNFLIVDVSGDQNSLYITQDFVPSSAASAAARNEIMVSITGSGNGGLGGLWSNGLETLAGLSPGRLTQTGSGNAIGLTVNGDSNLFAFLQSGHGNRIVAEVAGQANQMAVAQSGFSNHASLSQTGSRNMIMVSQSSY